MIPILFESNETVSPRKGRWIEIHLLGIVPVPVNVSPRKGRWIEIIIKHILSERSGFSP